jgi:phospholipid-translocating ATPase
LSPTLTPVSPITTWVPLLIIFSISAIKEGLDDFRRYKADREANKRLYTVVRSGSEFQQQSEHLRVGEIIRIEQDCEFPCDMVVLKSSEENGSCYIQTANLDGEADLKPRMALPETARLTLDELNDFDGVVECPPPNNHIYSFDATLNLSDHDGDQSDSQVIRGKKGHKGGDGIVNMLAGDMHPQLCSLSSQQLLLQGTFLRSTSFVYGMAVYTGNETKLGMNKSKPKTKWTKLDRTIDMASRFIFVVQLLTVVVFGVVGNVIQQKWIRSSHWYLQWALGNDPWYEELIIPIRMLLLLSYMIPISLKVTLDISKYSYAIFIGWVSCDVQHKSVRLTGIEFFFSVNLWCAVCMCRT